MSRTSHETLDNKDPFKTTDILFMFYGFNKGLKYDESFLVNNNLDSFITVPLYFSDTKLQVPEALEVLMKDALEHKAAIVNFMNKAD